MKKAKRVKRNTVTTKPVLDTREAKLAWLLRLTWEALPPILAEDAGYEVDMVALCKIADDVAEVLG